jgi:hypothetical protein
METAEMPQHRRVDQENAVSVHSGILCSREEERDVIIRWEMDGIGEHHSE